MRKFILCAICVSCFTSAESLADPITVVPTGLSLGEQYRLAFVTSTTRDATSSNIADYNAFVTATANAVPELAALGITWKAIGSTITVDAQDNTHTNLALDGLGVPIYLLNDTLFVSNNDDLWAPSPVNHSSLGVTENGSSPGPLLVWTGTNTYGTTEPPYQLGEGNPALGYSPSTSAGWIWGNYPSEEEEHHFYAVSDTTMTVIPEPGTATLLVLGLVGLAAAGRRRSLR